MSRSVLFAWVRRNMRLAQTSNATGIPADEIAEMYLERRATRREFLAGSAMAAAGVAAARCAPLLMPPRGAEPVLIVGAGIAGLTAAYRLEQAGVAVRLMEAQNRVGGRMFSLRNFFPDGQVAELGGELIDTGHDSILKLAAELDIQLDDLADEDPTLATEIWFFDRQRRTNAEVIEAFRPIAKRVEQSLATLTADDVTYSEPANAEGLDRISITQWLDGAGVSGWMRTLLEVAYTTEFGLECGEQSALNFLTMIDPQPDPFRIFGESDERFRVHNGNDEIIQALARRLRVQPETNMALEAIRSRPDGRLEASFRRGDRSVAVAAERMILTLPFTMLREVSIEVDLPPAKRKAIAELGYGTNAKLMTGFHDRIWRRQGSNGSVLTSLPFQLCWETSRKQPGKSGLLTNFTGGIHGIELGRGSEAEQAARFSAELDGVFPGVAQTRNDRQVRFHWPTHPFTRGSYACYRVGQWTTIRGAEGEPAGGLHFAGEHCSLDYQGFINGGSETGERAAAEVLAALGARASRAA